jgi:hypothetical protein
MNNRALIQRIQALAAANRYALVQRENDRRLVQQIINAPTTK